MLIALTVCTMLGQPACTDEQIPLPETRSPMQCLIHAPMVIAQWMTEHYPDQRVSQWKCITSELRERRT